jgi:hypothetical protein
MTKVKIKYVKEIKFGRLSLVIAFFESNLRINGTLKNRSLYLSLKRAG